MIYVVALSVLLAWLPVKVALPSTDKNLNPALSMTEMSSWFLGLLFVLGIFLTCAWAVRKLNSQVFDNTEKMRIVGGLSLGMREKLVLVQIGNKQLILGVTPQRIEKIQLLEGEDCLKTAFSNSTLQNNQQNFAQKLAQAMKVKRDDA